MTWCDVFVDTAATSKPPVLAGGSGGAAAGGKGRGDGTPGKKAAKGAKPKYSEVP